MLTMSFNVLCAGNKLKKTYWTDRKFLVSDLIRKYRPDTFGLQEAHHRWMRHICNALPEYDYVGVGRDNGKRMGEFSPVFYLKDKYDVADSGTFWLSETPDKPSKGWDGACIRICSWAVLKEKATGKQFVHFNTHLDHVGPTAQREGAKLIAERSLALKDLPAIMTGDFNVEPDSEAFKTVIDAGFEEARFASGKTDEPKTFHDFERREEKDRSIIDYIFVRNGFQVKDYKVITEKPGGFLPSDHYPVIAELEF
ncbi:MAG: endonuclease/exonuclease/phosphatase family protein [Clostridia bacterium]|nr:endonuclease/exonuclease/phosphatase family protein [Clostridia bacterium]